METFCKIKAAAIILAASLSTGTAFAYEAWPDDFPTIEALISAHKHMKKAEDLAVLELGAIEETHSLTQKATAAVNRTRSVLNRRMSDANSYMSLALQLSNVTTKTAGIVESYADFTKMCYNSAQKNPFVLAYYTNANLQLKKEIKHVERLIAGYSAAGINIVKATMEEKYRILALISNELFRIEMIISRARFMCRSVMSSGVQMWHVDDIIRSDLSDLISEKLIALWNKR